MHGSAARNGLPFRFPNAPATKANAARSARTKPRRSDAQGMKPAGNQPAPTTEVAMNGLPFRGSRRKPFAKNSPGPDFSARAAQEAR